MYLLDANVLISLGDPTHVHYQRSWRWFRFCESWVTCPLTENAFIRILGHKNYPDFAGGTNEARLHLEAMTAGPGHQFWPADISLIERTLFPELSASKHLTDVYLLGLAVKREAKFATLDERIEVAHVSGGAEACFLVPK